MQLQITSESNIYLRLFNPYLSLKVSKKERQNSNFIYNILYHYFYQPLIIIVF